MFLSEARLIYPVRRLGPPDAEKDDNLKEAKISPTNSWHLKFQL
ncbi:hypothetical protein PC116_g31764 [Phytophthora cactorum]|nr:hypothetical protein PC116_g31764 [Phytophthora cactorum]